VPGCACQPAPQLLQVLFEAGEHVQGGGRLQLPGRRQVRGSRRPHRGGTLPGAQRARAQLRAALVEEDRVDALHPRRVLGPQIVIQLQQRPAFQDAGGRDPALREPAVGQQPPQVRRVGLVRLGMPLAAAGSRGVGRLGDMRRAPGR
jgi:hypothetical protein